MQKIFFKLLFKNVIIKRHAKFVNLITQVIKIDFNYNISHFTVPGGSYVIMFFNWPISLLKNRLQRIQYLLRLLSSIWRYNHNLIYTSGFFFTNLSLCHIVENTKAFRFHIPLNWVKNNVTQRKELQEIWRAINKKGN